MGPLEITLIVIAAVFVVGFAIGTMSKPPRRTAGARRHVNGLEEAIGAYVADGYIVTAQAAGAAQLVRRKTFSFPWALIWFLLYGIGLVLYVCWYLAKNDETMYITVEPDGSLRGRGTGEWLLDSTATAVDHSAPPSAAPRPHSDITSVPMVGTPPSNVGTEAPPYDAGHPGG